MQTAVIGDEHSDVPVVLPAEAIELDVFRRTHTHDTFWCGLLLGGCGLQLTTKLYTGSVISSTFRRLTAPRMPAAGRKSGSPVPTICM
ncbi:hypothetical protein U5640_11670 [Streptomyces sp. SS7]|uniref:hypothetical protein n=1 Tax=Streptomyces sp. SS7 TaxID=3108485 RepID=UPI0030EE86B8